MSVKNSITTTSGIEWNTVLGLLQRLKNDNQFRDYLLIATGCYFGLRIGDLLQLNWSDVLDKDEIFIIESKTRKRRKLTINPNLKDVFKIVKESKERMGIFNSNDYLFANRRGGRLTVQYVNKRLHQIFKKYNVSVQNGSSHTLRKTFGKRVFESNDRSERALIYLSDIFSHNQVSVTRRYIGMTEKLIADIYLKL